MNDEVRARGYALFYFLIFLLICGFIIFFKLFDTLFEADLKARPEVTRARDVREDFALIIMLLDPSGSMGDPPNLTKAKNLVNEQLIPKCGAGDECVAFFISDRFNSGNQLFPGDDKCGANAGEKSSTGLQCPHLPVLKDEPAVLDLLGKIPKRSPGIRLQEQEQALINGMPRLRQDEQAAHKVWKQRVSDIKRPPRHSDLSEICEALKAIGNRFKNSRYNKKLFIAISDLKHDVRRANGNAGANREPVSCPPEFGGGFEDVNNVIVAPLEQIRHLPTFESKWSSFFNSTVEVHALSTVSVTVSDNVLAKNPTMGLEEFKRETKWTIFWEDTPWWLWVIVGVLVTAIAVLSQLRRRNADSPTTLFP